MPTCLSLSSLVCLLLPLLLGHATDRNAVFSPYPESTVPVVVVETQSSSPVLISPFRYRPSGPQSAVVEFCLVNRSTKPTVYVAVSAKLVYHLALPQQTGVRTTSALPPGWCALQSFGGGRGSNPADPLKEIRMSVKEVVFADGSRWADSPKPPEEPKSESGRGIL